MQGLKKTIDAPNAIYRTFLFLNVYLLKAERDREGERKRKQVTKRASKRALHAGFCWFTSCGPQGLSQAEAWSLAGSLAV